MEKMENQEQEQLRHIATSYQAEIFSLIADKYSALSEDLSILVNDESGVYLSKEMEDTLCVLVLDKNLGYMYLVSAKLNEEDGTLSDFKSDVIA